MEDGKSVKSLCSEGFLIISYLILTLSDVSDQYGSRDRPMLLDNEIIQFNITFVAPEIIESDVHLLQPSL